MKQYLSKLKYIFKLAEGNEIVEKNKVLTIFRFIRWQMISRFSDWAFIVPFANKTRLLVRRNMHGASGSVYLGLIEYADMAFLMHYLREEDMFYDIGANVGTYSILASGVCGSKTMTLEPIPETYPSLCDNIELNDLGDRIVALNKGVGSTEGKLSFQTDLGCSNCVVDGTGENVVTVDVITVDQLARMADLPSLIKIDVEGYEWEVLKGGNTCLEDPKLNVIIIELKGHADQYGSSDAEIDRELRSFGFVPCTYKPATRNLVQLDSYDGKHNTIYVRDLELTEKRVRDAAPFEVLGVKV